MTNRPSEQPAAYGRSRRSTRRNRAAVAAMSAQSIGEAAAKSFIRSIASSIGPV